MRLHDYLTEEAKTTLKQQVTKYIDYMGWGKPNEILKDAFLMNPVLFRGSRQHIDSYVATPRQDRRPRDTKQDVHEVLDNYFEKKFGWKARSEGVFVSPNAMSAKSFSTSSSWKNTYMIFPKGSFKYIWSPIVTDLYDTLNSTPKPETEEGWTKYLDGLLYTDKDMEKNETREVMLKCSSYTAISMFYFPYYLTKFKQKPLDKYNIGRIHDELNMELRGVDE